MARDELIEVMAREIDHALVWEVEGDTRAGELTQREQRAVAAAALAAIEAQGFAIVPVEPTEAICDAGTDYLEGAGCNPLSEDAERVYRAMIAAAQEQSND